ALYTNKSINMLFVDTIKALSNKLEREGYETQGEPNVLDRAATYAYFALPYSEQQHEFVSGTAQKQAMVIIMLELAYGEFLANQGEYLEKNNSDVESWADESLVTYGNHKVSYNSIKDEFLGDNKDYDCVLYAFDKISQMYSTSINIDASSYTGDYNDQVTYMGRYFQPEDAKSVELTINSFQNEYNYNDNKAIYELCDGLECTGLVTKANHFKSEKVRFNRIVPGNNSSQVYYILDASYYGELELRSLYNRIKREGPLGGSDNVYGDFHVASMDYINLRKEMSDGTNTYKCPSDLNTSLINLNKTVAFAAAYGSVPVNYYGKYLPVDPSANQNFKLLEDDYYLDLDLNFGDGPYMVRDADADFANLNKGTATDYKFNINNINFSSIAGSSDLYTVIVANTSGDYKQKVTLDYNSDSAQFLIDDGSDIITSSGTVKSGNDITLKIKPEDGNNIKSLKCIRKNAETTQTVLIDEGEAEYFYNEKSGYYEFNYNMPYSETQFVLETEKGIPSDSDGTFIIKSYGDLLALAENINNGNEKYKSGNYILANDIVCPANTEWSLPIGTYDKPFCGTFDGHNHVISGLTIRKDIDRTVGLFGALKGATIKNLHIKDACIDFETDAYNPVFDGPDRQVGVLCGEAYYESSISGCTVSGSVKVKGAIEVGGMCGYATDTIFEKCINYCDVSSDSENIGGLLANSLYITKLYNCANFGDVTADSSLYCGGIVGGGMANNYYIYNSYNVGKVGGTMVSLYSGDDYFIGALGGESPNVTNCYILDNNPDLKPQGTVCTLEQFKSGEVCYRLNITSVLPDYAWFQSIDNGETPDDYPTLDFKKNKIVFKVTKEDKNYSNTPNGYLLGDTDLDSDITIMDATLIQYHCALLYELTDMSLVNGDVNKDKIISITDATRIQAHIAGLMPIE
ncbi:MAG: dockerin type I repeat-containing protein, partial [Ruminococcus sp.]|nr:dockerin type I repeat-containing protein [Ruminococcus sp.]